MKCFYFRDKSKAGSKSSPEPRKRGEDTVRTPPRSKSVLQSPRRRGMEELYRERQREGVVREFGFWELRDATCGFSRLLRIGRGGFGNVYKGTIKVVAVDGKTTTTTTTTMPTTRRPLAVAIKRLNQHGLQGHKEWQAEVQFLSVVDHPNLVKLLGYCSMENEKGPQLLLVYEYMPNRSLDGHLFSQALPVLPWKRRLEIILGAAEGLAYLHGGMEITVIYRDFKASNVLLDEDFRAKLSDFGLAREGPVDNRSHVTTAVVGTYGYAAPEYIETGHLTIHSDVWAFGVVLYELLTGRRAVEMTRPQNEQKLLDWVKYYPADGRTFSMIVDPRLRNQYSYSAAKKVGKLAESCLNKNAKDRPTMRQVTAVLKQAIHESQDMKGSGDRSPCRRHLERSIGGFLERGSEG